MYSRVGSSKKTLNYLEDKKIVKETYLFPAVEKRKEHVGDRLHWLWMKIFQRDMMR